jgi:hypothetical protein
MRTSVILTGLVVTAAVAVGCGGNAPQERAAKAGPAVTLAEREAQLEQDPYNLACADLADKVASASMTRRVQFALAADARIPGMSPLRASQSIFYAITEICKDKPASYKPARPAIAGVRSGEFVADLGSP